MKIGNNIYMILAKKLEYYGIETSWDIDSGEVEFSVSTCNCFETSEALKEHISFMDTALEIMEMLEGLDLVYDDEDVELDDELLAEISTRIELYLDDLRYLDLKNLLEKYEPKKPDFIQSLDAEKVETINKILRMYHRGMICKGEVMPMITNQVFGKF